MLIGENLKLPLILWLFHKFTGGQSKYINAISPFSLKRICYCSLGWNNLHLRKKVWGRARFGDMTVSLKHCHLLNSFCHCPVRSCWTNLVMSWKLERRGSTAKFHLFDWSSGTLSYCNEISSKSAICPSPSRVTYALRRRTSWERLATGVSTKIRFWHWSILEPEVPNSYLPIL